MHQVSEFRLVFIVLMTIECKNVSTMQSFTAQ